MNLSSLPRHPRTGVRAVGIVGGRPVYPIKGGAPTLTEQRDAIIAQLRDPDFDGDLDDLDQRAEEIEKKIEAANRRDARLRALSASTLPAGDPQPTPEQRTQPGMQPDDQGRQHPVTAAEAFIRSKALETFRSNGAVGKFSVEHRDAPTGTVTTTNGIPTVPQRVPGAIPQNPDFPLLIANLLDRQTSTGNTLEYVRDTSGPVEGSGTWNKAAVVPEGTMKPQSGPFSWDTITTSLKTVAHWVPVTRQAVDDDGQMMGYINGRLTYGLEFQMDRQILTGNGTTQMQGILTTPGIGAYQPASGSTDSKLITLRKAKTQGELALYPPDAVVLNPLDWQDIELDQDGIGQFRVITDVTAGSAAFRIWGLQVVTSVAMAAGTALLGGYRTGATLWERQGITILMSDSHADLFLANTFVILAERRANVAVHTPRAFVKVTFAAAA
ncbi:phage major capsid protein [Streptomyces sp. NPDC049967]|uniref:phage major capsid protein n=1 Tax=unclassified Streptomyces TaxID=2593676 RepID=UPI0034398D5D